MKIYSMVENHIEKRSSTGNTFLANPVFELTPSPERDPQVRICPSPLNINDGYYGLPRRSVLCCLHYLPGPPIFGL